MQHRGLKFGISQQMHTKQNTTFFKVAFSLLPMLPSNVLKHSFFLLINRSSKLSESTFALQISFRALLLCEFLSSKTLTSDMKISSKNGKQSFSISHMYFFINMTKVPSPKYDCFELLMRGPESWYRSKSPHLSLINIYTRSAVMNANLFAFCFFTDFSLGRGQW